MTDARVRHWTAILETLLRTGIPFSGRLGRNKVRLSVFSNRCSLSTDVSFVSCFVREEKKRKISRKLCSMLSHFTNCTLVSPFSARYRIIYVNNWLSGDKTETAGVVFASLVLDVSSVAPFSFSSHYPLGSAALALSRCAQGNCCLVDTIRSRVVILTSSAPIASL